MAGRRRNTERQNPSAGSSGNASSRLLQWREAITELRPRLIRFLGAFVVATLAWMVYKLSNDYTLILSVPVRYVNPPGKYKVSSPLPTQWSVLVRGKGKDLILPYYKWGIDTVKVNLTRRGEPGRPVETIYTANEKRRIRRKLPVSVKVVSVAPAKLDIRFSPKIYKMVPVKSNLEVIPETGFFLTEPVSFKPDSVLISGTPEQLADYQSWLTARVTFTGFNRNIKRSVELLDVDEIEINPKKVTAYFKTARFTEGEVEKDVIVENVPVNEKVEIIPGKVKIKYLVPLESFSRITEKDFRVIINYDRIHPEAKFLVPVLQGTPGVVKGVRLEPAYVRYLITTRP